MADSTPSRRPYNGSCRCGAVKYIIFLTLPHVTPPPGAQFCQRIYRCNCTICHKAGLMHVRLSNPPEDFILLSPLDPYATLGDYQCVDRNLHFLFCKTCGIRCFTIAGEGEVADVRLKDLGVEGADQGDGEETKVWMLPKEGWKPDSTRLLYLSINGHTLDAGQEGLDLREWTEKKWVTYIDCLDLDGTGEKPGRLDRPHEGGAY